MKQWMLSIRKYAKRLSDDLNNLNWPKSIKLAQNKWIGMENGYKIKFKVNHCNLYLYAFINNLNLLKSCYKIEISIYFNDILQYLSNNIKIKLYNIINKTNKLTNLQLFDKSNHESINTNLYCINPLNNNKIPIFITNSFIDTNRDINARIVTSIDPLDSTEVQSTSPPEVQSTSIRLADSSSNYISLKSITTPGDRGDDSDVTSSGEPVADLREAEGEVNKGSCLQDDLGWKGEWNTSDEIVNEYDIDSSYCEKYTNFKLHDWIFSRQRYWGEPIPILTNDNNHNNPLEVNPAVSSPPDVQSTSPCLADSSPPEVQSTSPCPADSSSNYLPVNGITTPGDRGDDSDVTSSGEPVADLREAEGEVNRRADGRTSGGTASGKESRTVTSGIKGVDEFELRSDVGTSSNSDNDDHVYKLLDIPVKVESNISNETMPQWAGSSWHYLRFTDPNNDEVIFDYKKAKYWMPVDLYIGGNEHSISHLLYSRFWNKILYDLGISPVSEPFKEILLHGMINNAKYYDDDGNEINEDKIIKFKGKYVLKDNKNKNIIMKSIKMSKSKGNIIKPDDIINKFSADTLRLHLLFLSPIEFDKLWIFNGIYGVYKLLINIYNIFYNLNYNNKLLDNNNNEINIEMNKFINIITNYIKIIILI